MLWVRFIMAYVIEKLDTKPENFPGLKFYNMQKIDKLGSPSQKNKTPPKVYGKPIP
jgi:hypothetical protein